MAGAAKRSESGVVQAVRFTTSETERLLRRAFDTISRNPARWALISVATGVVAGGSIFSFVEDKSIPDGVWWAFVSIICASLT